eukprot:CAMPEP_0173423712 /NCGR_PEP_ID=MMETSP1357-20121228/3907_1 /TAXON_ID=77926 /ORGANISM="Hemiselmis rufescens, Strain PCC563" /LENGTH=163 /DNA_ID=CAMNT_0014386863 /DNA_START=217 /DNA_END=708 /DNA_ORIENTATION=-
MTLPGAMTPSCSAVMTGLVTGLHGDSSVLSLSPSPTRSVGGGAFLSGGGAGWAAPDHESHMRRAPCTRWLLSARSLAHFRSPSPECQCPSPSREPGAGGAEGCCCNGEAGAFLEEEEECCEEKDSLFLITDSSPSAPASAHDRRLVFAPTASRCPSFPPPFLA